MAKNPDYIYCPACRAKDSSCFVCGGTGRIHRVHLNDIERGARKGAPTEEAKR